MSDEQGPTTVEELDSALREAAQPRPRMSAARAAMLFGLAAAVGGVPPDPFARRQKLDAANSWRISETDFNAQAIAKAEAKRARKAAQWRASVRDYPLTSRKP